MKPQQRNMATPTKSLPRDPNTFANYDKFRTTHTTANFEIEFEQQRLVGNVIHQLKSMTNAESKEIVLDSSFVDVDEIKIDGKKASFEVLPRSEPFGSAVKVTLDAGVELDKTLELDVRFPFIQFRNSRLMLGVDLRQNHKGLHRFAVAHPCANFQQEASLHV